MAQTAAKAGTWQEARLHVGLLFYICSRTKKEVPLCKEWVAYPGWGEGLCLVRRPPSLRGWTMGPLVIGVGGQVAPSVMRFLSQEACDPKTSASRHRRWGGAQLPLEAFKRQCWTLSGAEGGRSGWPREWLCLQELGGQHQQRVQPQKGEQGVLPRGSVGGGRPETGQFCLVYLQKT